MNHTYLKVGYACNNDCTHCVIVDQKKQALKLRGDISRKTSECKEEICKSRERGCRFITFTGGEPTIRKDIFELLEYAKLRGFTIYLQSNGRKFSDKSFALRAAGYVEGFLIPLHSYKPQVHDMVTTKKNSFEQTVNGIRNLVEAGSNVGIKIMALNSNYKDLTRMIKFIQTLGLNHARISFPHPNGNAYNNFDEVIPYYKSVKPFIEECLEYSISENFDIELETIMPCALDKVFPLKYFANIRNPLSNDLEVKQLDYVFDDWSIVRKKIHRKDMICEKCVYNSFCEGYWREYVERRGFDEFTPVKNLPDEIKKMIKARLSSWK